MRILITGAGGNLGRAAIPELESRGHVVRLADMRPIETDREFRLLDVRDREAVREAVAGCDAVVHAAALHGIHLSKWTPEDFWDINVTGTFNVFEAARREGMRKVVLCSTMGVYGAGLERSEGAWGYCDEACPLLPQDVYGLSKRLAEEIGTTYGRQWGVETVALRLGMFVPESTFERYGFRLLFGGVDERDVAQAVGAALDFSPRDGFKAFNVMAPVPFSREETRDLATDLVGTLERHFPGVQALLAERGVDAREQVWWPVVWSSVRAQERMGYHPRYGFGEFLAAYREGDTSHCPVLGSAWWGV
jgi:nucleoside-diphosphate-sugar epimerase